MLRRLSGAVLQTWGKLGLRYMPFADVATPDLPLSRLWRLSLFQLSVGMVQTLFVGTLNRVMILELGVPATIVAIGVAIPLLIAPFRALIGFRSDTYRCVLGWRRVPFIWFGTLMQFGGLAIMPFALLTLSPDATTHIKWVGYVGSALAFFLVGAGAHTTQTAGLALASDIAPDGRRPRVVAMMYLTLLMGTVLSAFLLGMLLREYSPIRLIEVIQGAAVVTMVLNTVCLWKQEARVRGTVPYRKDERRPIFREAWGVFTEGGRAVRLLVAVGLGFFAFNMQDVLLEPYGGEILHLSVGQTTGLTGIMAAGAIVAFWLAAKLLERGWDPIRIAAYGALVGILAFAAVIFASPLESSLLFRTGTALIGLGEGMFGVGTLSAAMGLRDERQHGIALGAWGAVFATAEGVALALSGVIRDWLAGLVSRGALGEGLMAASVPYSVVYHLEIAALFATLIALGPLVAPNRIVAAPGSQSPLGLADLPA
ncbi:MAG: BCD family MFS transporter [Gemmatimonadales bacterium]